MLPVFPVTVIKSKNGQATRRGRRGKKQKKKSQSVILGSNCENAEHKNIFCHTVKFHQHSFLFKMLERWWMFKHKYVSSKHWKHNPGLNQLLVLIWYQLRFPIWCEGFLVLPAIYPYKILESELITIKTFMLKSYIL